MRLSIDKYRKTVAKQSAEATASPLTFLEWCKRFAEEQESSWYNARVPWEVPASHRPRSVLACDDVSSCLFATGEARTVLELTLDAGVARAATLLASFGTLPPGLAEHGRVIAAGSSLVPCLPPDKQKKSDKIVVGKKAKDGSKTGRDGPGRKRPAKMRAAPLPPSRIAAPQLAKLRKQAWFVWREQAYLDGEAFELSVTERFELGRMAKELEEQRRLLRSSIPVLRNIAFAQKLKPCSVLTPRLAHVHAAIAWCRSRGLLLPHLSANSLGIVYRRQVPIVALVRPGAGYACPPFNVPLPLPEMPPWPAHVLSESGLRRTDTEEEDTTSWPR